MKLRIFLIVFWLMTVSGCADLFRATTLGQRIERDKQRKIELKMREQEAALFVGLFLEANERGDTERCNQLIRDYDKKIQHYELKDRLDRIEDSQREHESAEYRRWLQDNY